MSGAQPILVVGGTRGTGLLIARLLHRQGLPVRALARNPARAVPLLGSGIDVVRGDLTKPDTLPAAINGVRDIILTAGCRSGYPVRESVVRATEYEGVLNTLTTATRAGFGGRFLYMTASVAGRRSFWTFALNLWKGNTLEWRWRAENAIRESGLNYCVIRAAFLVNRPAGTHRIEVTRRPLPLSPRCRIARADVAEAFVAALSHPRAARTTFEIGWGKGPRRESWSDLLDKLAPDHGY